MLVLALLALLVASAQAQRTGAVGLAVGVVGGFMIPRRVSRPFMVLLETDKGLGNVGTCGGALIDDRTVLSAAHCVMNDAQTQQIATKVRVLFNDGGRRRGRNVWSGEGNVAIHPEYIRNPTAANDLMVVRLPRAVTDGIMIRPISLARQNPAVGTYALSLGYGVTDHDMTRLSDDLKGVRNPIVQCPEPSLRTVCTRGIDDRGQRGNTCVGDSGGPLIVGSELVGIISRGSEDCGRAAVDEATYASVAGNRDFISRYVVFSPMRAPSRSNPPRRQQRAPATTTTTTTTTTVSRRYTVRRGDSLESIAARHHVPLQELINANWGRRFYEGAVLVIPARRIVRVRSHDTGFRSLHRAEDAKREAPAKEDEGFEIK